MAFIYEHTWLSIWSTSIVIAFHVRIWIITFIFNAITIWVIIIDIVPSIFTYCLWVTLFLWWIINCWWKKIGGMTPMVLNLSYKLTMSWCVCLVFDGFVCRMMEDNGCVCVLCLRWTQFYWVLVCWLYLSKVLFVENKLLVWKVLYSNEIYSLSHSNRVTWT